MKDLLDAFARLVGRLGALALVLALAACGPGSGGTGGGEGPMSFSGTLTYSSALAGTAAAAGCATGDPRLRLEQAVVELRFGCMRFVHEGEWRLEAGNQATVAGTLEITANGGTQSSSGSLRLQFDAEPAASREVSFTLLDATGNVLAGPQALQRQ